MTRRLKLTFGWAQFAGICGAGMVLFAGVVFLHGSYLESVGPGFSGSLLLWIGWLLKHTRQEFKRFSRLASIIDTTDLIVIATDRHGFVNRFNPAASRALGYPAEEVIGKVKPSIFHVEADSYTDVSSEAAHREWTYLRKDGTVFPAIVTLSSILSDRDEVLGHFEMGIDITERKANEEALRDKQELIESIATTSPTIFYTFDLRERRMLYLNRHIGASLGYDDSACAAMGSDPLPSIMHPEDLDILFNRYQACLSMPDGQVLENEFRCLSAMGELKWLYTRDVVFKRDDDGVPIQILVNVVDVTDRKLLDEQIESQVLEIQDTNLALEIQTNALEEANAQLESLAFADGLTGIANHRSFQEALAKAFANARKKEGRLALMLMDVDRFKDYNDQFGHPAGDVVLKRVAQIIKENSPDKCMPARYGGEEFAILCEGYTGNAALDLAEQIRVAIEEYLWTERKVTVSIGAVAISTEITTPSQFVKAADNALYSSKASGRNCVTMYDMARRAA